MQPDFEKLMGEYVQFHRRELGLTQEQLAARLAELGEPMHATAVTRLERGGRSLRFNEWVALMQALDRPLPDFFAYVSTVADFGERLSLEMQESEPLSLIETAEQVNTIVALASTLMSDALDRVRDRENP
ncbi:helix-turn-helix transcriptional regulator [Nocardioides sp. GY 10127]|uniref:helix-turn-helix domain-containing protein n=1 Tax=Nocardioides sp. GY 10127 TaxID=2569762 RepID=UPI0010A789ED|nr:helix-turn-helix transcriptional regulator [Nocardioides sp. GY 10127]TIC84104.1 helix-turn-helix transcriptional regulator [Nocardioides sp. GY 10127]